MIKGYTKQTIIICFLLQGIALSSRAQEQQMWQRYHDKCRREASIIDTLPSKLEKALHWSPTINKEQKEVIRYILWNMVYVEGGTANLGDNNNYPVDVASFFINRYEVSQDEWYVIMGENPSNQHRRNYPVDQVNWYDTQRFTRKLSQLSGLPFRLPFEAEWEYAAYGLIGNTQDERISNSRIYPWDGSWVRYAEKKHRGRMMANFTRGKGDYMGVAGSANDGWDYTSPVRSFWPNDFGLYDMAGNVNEWVADVYRTLSFQDMAEFNPYRGNVFQSPVLNEDGTAAPKDSLGRMRYRNQTDAELANRENYRTADNRNFNDGDLKSRISGDIDWRNTENDRGTHDMYYNDGKGEITTLIDDEARVYKGGSWKDRAYWLNPGSRRYMNQKRSSNDIGFRCAMSHVGNATGGKKNKVSQK